MDSPICAKHSGNGFRIEIFRRFGRILAPDGEIAMEFAAAHVRAPIDRARWPKPMPPDVPADAIAIDRYGDYRPGRLTPHGIVNPALTAAIRAMLPADVTHMQCDDNGCGVAAAAHICGETYAAMRARLAPGTALRILGVSRFAAISGTTPHICRSGGWAEALNASAVAALIRRASARWGHYVAMSAGVVIDPELVEHYPVDAYPRRTWRVLRFFTRPR